MSALILFLLAQAEEYYPLKAGLKWTYKCGGKESVTKITGKEEVGGVECFISEAKGEDGWVEREHVAVSSEGVARFKPTKFLILKSAPKPGLKWEAAKGMAAEIAAEEKVKVPAGTYKALKVVIKGRVGEKNFAFTYWYAKGVGKVREEYVKDGSDTEVEELVMFEQ